MALMSDPVRESMERMQAMVRGPKGERGERGAQGQLSRPLRRAVVYLFAVAVGLALAVGIGGFVQYRHAEAMQRQQGQAVERKLCTTMARLAALRPPPGNPEVNPARGYDQQLHATLDQLGPDLGCR
jgi:hypothetical protein